MYTISICSGDKQFSNNLKNSIQSVLTHMNATYVVYYHEKSDSLYKALQKYPEKYNLLFLDTDLKPYNGIELARKLRKNNYRGSIVLVSQDSTYVFDGYDVDACQYLLKPVSQDKLQSMFFKMSVKSLQQTSSQHLLLNSGSTYRRILYRDIEYIETAGRKVAIHTTGPVFYYRCKLSEMEELLPSNLFFRCHQSFIIQFYAVEFITKNTIIMKNGMEMPISRTYAKNVHEILGYTEQESEIREA